jgi:hypothetical protein
LTIIVAGKIAWVAERKEKNNMAILSTEKRSGKVTGYNIQWLEGQKRLTIHLGRRRYAKKTAERLKEIVEILLFNRRNGVSVFDKRTEYWLHSAPTELRMKLAKAGLLIVQETKTCQQLWDAYLEHKMDFKKSTVNNYKNSRKHFFGAFLPSEPIGQVTPVGELFCHVIVSVKMTNDKIDKNRLLVQIQPSRL